MGEDELEDRWSEILSDETKRYWERVKHRENLSKDVTPAIMPLILGMLCGISGMIAGMYFAGAAEIPLWLVMGTSGAFFLLLGLFAYRYLEGGQSGLLTKYLRDSLGQMIGVPDQRTLESSASNQQINELRADIILLRKELHDLASIDKNNNYDDIVSLLKGEVIRGASSEFVRNVEKQIGDHINSDYFQARHAMESFSQTRLRIGDALIGLGRRGRSIL